ncbi:MAG: hypothetical protein V7L23_22990 [Nostoc sp.]
MRIAILVEGATETAFKPILENFLKSRLQQTMPELKFIRYDGRIRPLAELLLCYSDGLEFCFW